jgi:hypothetical protein
VRSGLHKDKTKQTGSSSRNHGRGEEGGGGYRSWKDSILLKLKANAEANEQKWEDFVDELRVHMGMSVDEYISALGNADHFRETFLQPRFDPSLLLREVHEEQKAFEGKELTEEELRQVQDRLRRRRERASDLKVRAIIARITHS